MFWRLIWLTPLLYTAYALPEVDPTWPAAVGLAVFVETWVALLWRPGTWQATDHSPSRGQLAGLATVAVGGVGLAAAYATSPGGWESLLIYVSVAGVVILPLWRPAAVWIAATVAVLVAIGLVRDPNDAPVGGTAWSLVMSGLVVGLLRQYEVLVVRLRRTQNQLAEAAVEAERSRVSRDLHDLPGHTLSLIVVKAEVVRRALDRDPPRAAGEVAEIEQIGRRALSEVRDTVGGHRAPTLAAELDEASNALADAGVEVTVRSNGTALPGPVGNVLGWVVREPATNVLRHSRARRCTIEVRTVDGRLTLEVRDDGTGMRARQRAPTRGLAGMAARLEEIGGELETGNAAAGGWRVAATVPVQPVDRP